MALTTVLWTINGLATELGISHRVLGRRLSNLAPDEVEQQAGRQVKRWRLARVLKHLKAADRTSAGVDGQLIEDHKHVVTEFLFPALTGSRYFSASSSRTSTRTSGSRKSKRCRLTRPRSSRSTWRSASSSPGSTPSSRGNRYPRTSKTTSSRSGCLPSFASWASSGPRDTRRGPGRPGPRKGRALE